jgi:hypothetical protein
MMLIRALRWVRLPVAGVRNVSRQGPYLLDGSYRHSDGVDFSQPFRVLPGPGDSRPALSFADLLADCPA